MVTTFITILAYAGAVIGILMALLHLYLHHDYHQKDKNGRDSINKLLDKMQGVERGYKPGKWWLIALISWAWLIATWVS